MLEAGSGTKFLTIFANPTLWTLFGSHKELGGTSYKVSRFILAMAIHTGMIIIQIKILLYIKKLLIVGVYKLLASFK